MSPISTLIKFGCGMTEEEIGPDIFTYTDVLAYLRDFAAHKKEHSYGFSFRQFSQRAGINSPNYFQKILKGEKQLSLKMGEKFLKGLGLKGTDAKYFRLMMRKKMGINEEDREGATRHLERIQMRQGTIPSPHIQDTAICKHYSLGIIRELVTIKGFELTPMSLAKALKFSVKENEAKKMIEETERAGFLRRNPETNAYECTHGIY